MNSKYTSNLQETFRKHIKYNLDRAKQERKAREDLKWDLLVMFICGALSAILACIVII